MAPSKKAFLNARIVTGTGDPPLDTGTLIVEEDRIFWIGPEENAPLEDAEVYDCTGKTILPGLIDAHCHLIYDNVKDSYSLELEKPLEQAAIEASLHAARLLKLGITSVRDVGTRGNIAVIIRDAVNQGLLPGPRIKAAKQIITVWGGLGDLHPTHIFGRDQRLHQSYPGLHDIITGPWEARSAVRQHIKDGADWIKVEVSGSGFNPLCPADRNTMSMEELSAVVEESTDKNRPVVCHAESRRGIIKAAEAGVRTIEHAVYLDDDGIQAVLDHDVAICPTLGLYSAFAEHGIKYGIPANIVKNHQRTHEHHVKAISKAYEMGVTIIAGSDSGLTNFPQGGLLQEICTYVEKVGLSEHEALLTATRDAAQVIGLSDEVGTLEPGKLADLIILRANPLQLITHITEPDVIVAVLKGGVLVSGELKEGEGGSI